MMLKSGKVGHLLFKQHFGSVGLRGQGGNMSLFRSVACHEQVKNGWVPFDAYGPNNKPHLLSSTSSGQAGQAGLHSVKNTGEGTNPSKAVRAN